MLKLTRYFFMLCSIAILCGCDVATFDNPITKKHGIIPQAYGKWRLKRGYEAAFIYETAYMYIYGSKVDEIVLFSFPIDKVELAEIKHNDIVYRLIECGIEKEVKKWFPSIKVETAKSDIKKFFLNKVFKATKKYSLVANREKMQSLIDSLFIKIPSEHFSKMVQDLKNNPEEEAPLIIAYNLLAANHFREATKHKIYISRLSIDEILVSIGDNNGYALFLLEKISKDEYNVFYVPNDEKISEFKRYSSEELLKNFNEKIRPFLKPTDVRIKKIESYPSIDISKYL